MIQSIKIDVRRIRQSQAHNREASDQVPNHPNVPIVRINDCSLKLEFARHFGTLGVLNEDSCGGFTQTFMSPRTGDIFAPSDSVHADETYKYIYRKQMKSRLFDNDRFAGRFIN